jgi:hypothetical protein
MTRGNARGAKGAGLSMPTLTSNPLVRTSSARGSRATAAAAVVN